MTQASMTLPQKMAFNVLLMVSLSHFLNDLVQSIIPAALPLLKEQYALTFAQVGLITLTVQVTSSIFQPIVGLSTDKRPTPFALPIGMCVTLVGFLLLASAPNFAVILVACGIAGLGSAIFHPEASKVTQTIAGQQKGFAQAVFQVGGNTGFACGPLAAALIVLPNGQSSIAWFALFALLAVALLSKVALAMRNNAAMKGASKPKAAVSQHGANLNLKFIFTLLFILMFSKQVYISSLSNYLTFYTIEKFGLSMANAQYVLFAFLAASAAGTLLGGPIGDRWGRRTVILWSILGAAPFALLLPWVPLAGVILLAILVGFVISSAFSAILVFALELAPARTGMIAGIFFGFTFGLSGIASAVLGVMADHIGLDMVFHIVAFLPLLGIVAFALPKKAEVA